MSCRCGWVNAWEDSGDRGRAQEDHDRSCNTEVIDGNGDRWYALDGIWYRRDNSDCRGDIAALARDFGPISSVPAETDGAR